MASLAELLDYDQRKKQALQALTDYASSQYKLGSTFGEGLSDQAKGLVQMARHPIDTAVDTATNIYQAGKAAIQDPRAAYQAAKEGLAETVSSPQNIARFAGQNFNPLELANALNKVGTMRELTVYHGTPHKFEPTPDNPLGEFTASKIGTGEGAAAYGHGIYVAQNPSVAKSYKTAGSNELHKRVTGGMNPMEEYAYDLASQGITGDDLFSKMHQKFKNQLTSDQKFNELDSAIKMAEKARGNFYKVDLPDEKIDLMLDWDKPLSEQSAHVQNAVLGDINLAIEQTKARISGASERKAFATKIELEKLEKEKNRMLNLFGEDLYKQMSLGEGKFAPDASSQLRQLGIPGIKYLDADSRGVTPPRIKVTNKGYELYWGNDPTPVNVFSDAGEASKAAKELDTRSRNFVVFPGEEKSLKILSRE